MRIPFDWNRNLMQSLDDVRQQIDVTQQQLTTGRRVNLPSDDPAAAAAWVENRSASSSNDQFSRNLSGLQATANTQDSAISQAVTAITQAISLGVEGANGTLSDQDRQAIAQQVSQIQSQLVDIGNTAINGIYVFAGTKVTTKPYALNAGSPSGVQYSGNGNSITVQIAPGQDIQLQFPGSQIFSTPGSDTFQAIQDLITALQTNNNIGGATTALRAALNAVNVQRVSVSTAISRLNDANQVLSNQQLQLSNQENTLVGADIAKAASDFAREQTALSAALASGAQITQLSLIDFLK